MADCVSGLGRFEEPCFTHQPRDAVAEVFVQAWGPRREPGHDPVGAVDLAALIAVSRLAADIGGGLWLRDEPLLASMFEVIDRHFATRISLADVAATLGLTPGHLTTVVRRKTGRTVQEWITERRMTQARKLLVETDLTVQLIANQAGFGGTSYFIKHFKREHRVTPSAWRRARRQRA